MTTRRGFLKKGLLGGLVLAVGGGGGLVLWPTRVDHQPRQPLKVFSEKEFAVFAAVAARVVTVAGADPVGIVHNIDHLFETAVPEARRDHKRLLGLYDNALAGLLFDGRPKPFTRLNGERQDEALRAWRDSKMIVRRAGYTTLRKLSLAAHYGLPSTWASVGYPGPPNISLPT